MNVSSHYPLYPLSDKQKAVIETRVTQGFALPCQLATQGLILDASGVLFWPKHNLLIFSDLHFEKASFLSQFAHPLPRFDTKDTLLKMQSCIELYQPAQVVCLGDSLHDANAVSRMPSSELSTINTMLSGVKKWYWVLGNHDPEIPKQISGVRVPHLVVDNVLLVHEPESLDKFDSVDAQVIGHYHPKTKFNITKHSLRGKCFLQDESILLMPAFGSYTGGLDIQHPAIQDLLSQTVSCYLMHGSKLFLMKV